MHAKRLWHISVREYHSQLYAPCIYPFCIIITWQVISAINLYMLLLLSFISWSCCHSMILPHLLTLLCSPSSSSYQLWCHSTGCPGFAAEQAGPSCPGHGQLQSDEGRCQHTKWVQRCHAVFATAGRTGEETGGSRVLCELHYCFINVHVLCQYITSLPINCCLYLD